MASVGADEEADDGLLVDGMTLYDSIDRLDADQMEILNLVANKRKSVLVHGKAGCGKSVVLNTLRQYCHNNNIPFIVAAPTGTAASKVGGSTIEFAFGLGSSNGKFLKDTNPTIASMTIQSRATDAKALFNEFKIPTGFSDLKMIMIDEISMCHRRLWELMDEWLRAVRDTDAPFGGVQMVLFGDFKQLAPVPLPGEVIDDIYCIASEQSWYGPNGLRPIIRCLKIQHRQDKDHAFNDLLTRMREGEMTEEDHQLLEARSREFVPFDRLVSHVLTTNTISDKSVIRSIVDYVGDIPLPLQICSLRKECETRNAIEYAKQDMLTERVFNISVQFVPPKNKKARKPLTDKQLYLRDKMIEESMRNARIGKTVELRVGTRVMLLRNMDVRSGRTTGATGTVVSFLRRSHLLHVPEVVFDGDTMAGAIAVDPYRFTFSPERMPGGGIAYVTQVPLIHAWAATTHSVQGASLTSAVIEADKFFADGQFYTAISRLRTFDGVILKAYRRDVVKINEFIKQYFLPHEKTASESKTIARDALKASRSKKRKSSKLG